MPTQAAIAIGWRLTPAKVEAVPCIRRFINWNTSGYPSSTSGRSEIPLIGCDSLSPIASAGRAKIKPAIGPAIPISKSADRDGIGLLILINAPMVPNRLGKGTKNGSVAFTR